MRVRSALRVRGALLAACLVLGACISHPQPDPTTITMMETQGWGGYIDITSIHGESIRGELLAVERDKVWVQEAARGRVWIAVPNIRHAALYKYESDWGFGLWGLAGSLSTVSHGFLLVLSLPIWVLSSSIAATAESHHVRIEYPDEDLEELRPWARYPQGMPAAERVPQPPHPPQPPHAPKPPHPPQANPPSSVREHAWLLTKQARSAARAGACDQVRALDREVRGLDADLHGATFIRDEAIRRCLGLPSLIAPPGATPPVTPAPPNTTPPITPAPPGATPPITPAPPGATPPPPSSALAPPS